MPPEPFTLIVESSIMPTEIITFGCRLNAYESEIIRKKSAEAGLQEREEDVVILNTCAVTNEALRQAKQAIRKIHRQRPNSKIIVTGCAAQIEAENFSNMPEVALVLGNNEKLQGKSYKNIPDFGASSFEKLRVNDIMEVQNNAPHMIDSFGGKSRAFVQIQNGCDHRCTFCIIPYTRGPSRSVPMGTIVQQIQHLVERGYYEIVLTGVDLTSYGTDLPVNSCLSTLIQAILKQVPTLPRLRISSIDSVEVDEEFFELLAYEKRIMPHLHLSLQAGDNIILKRMKRRHSRAQAIDFCQKLRSLRPNIVFGADLIAGFPTETEEMFKNTCDFIQECGLTHLHVFPFSPRQGTPAARMPQISKAFIKERASILRQIGKKAYNLHLDALQHSQQTLLVERIIEGAALGHTEDYTLTAFPADKLARYLGKLVKVNITSRDQEKLLATPL